MLKVEYLFLIILFCVLILCYQMALGNSYKKIRAYESKNELLNKENELLNKMVERYEKKN